MIKSLNNLDDWQKLKKSPDTFIIFKTSNTCPISAAAEERLQTVIEQIPVDVYQVVVQESREVSDQIALDLDIIHESPQLIVIRNNQAVYNKDHENIDPQDLIQFLAYA